MKYIIFGLLYTSSALTNLYAHTSLGDFCASSSAQFEQLKHEIFFLRTETDKIKLSKGCIQVLTTQDRLSLFEKVIQLKVPTASVRSTEDFSSTETCHLEFEEQIVDEKDSTSLGVGIPPVQLNHTKNKNRKIKSFQVKTLENEEFSIEVYRNIFYGICSIKNNSIRLKIRSRNTELGVNTSIVLIKSQKTKITDFVQNSQSNDHKVKIVKNRFQKQDSKRKIILFAKAK